MKNLRKSNLFTTCLAMLVSFSVIGFVGCEKEAFYAEDDASFITNTIESMLQDSSVVHVKFKQDENDDFKFKHAEFKLKPIIRLKSAKVESSDGEYWKDSDTKKKAMGAGKYVAEKMEEYGGDCIESRTEAIDEDGDGKTDYYKVYTRPCNWN